MTYMLLYVSIKNLSHSKCMFHSTNMICPKKKQLLIKLTLISQHWVDKKHVSKHNLLLATSPHGIEMGPGIRHHLVTTLVTTDWQRLDLILKTPAKPVAKAAGALNVSANFTCFKIEHPLPRLKPYRQASLSTSFGDAILLLCRHPFILLWVLGSNAVGRLQSLSST